MIRRIIGGGVALVALWQLWSGGQALAFGLSRGSDLATELFSPPTLVLRLAGAGLAFLGGALAAAGRPFGAMLAVAGAVVFSLLVGAMAGSGADAGLWGDEIAPLIIFWLGGLALLFVKR